MVYSRLLIILYILLFFNCTNRASTMFTISGGQIRNHQFFAGAMQNKSAKGAGVYLTLAEVSG